MGRNRDAPAILAITPAVVQAAEGTIAHKAKAQSHPAVWALIVPDLCRTGFATPKGEFATGDDDRVARLRPNLSVQADRDPTISGARRVVLALLHLSPPGLNIPKDHRQPGFFQSGVGPEQATVH